MTRMLEKNNSIHVNDCCVTSSIIVLQKLLMDLHGPLFNMGDFLIDLYL